jgi:hypothetical protein
MRIRFVVGYDHSCEQTPKEDISALRTDDKNNCSPHSLDLDF